MHSRVFVQVLKYLVQVRGRLGWTIACRRRVVRGRYTYGARSLCGMGGNGGLGASEVGDEGWTLVVSGKVCVCRVGCRRFGVGFW